jgi:excisionase family DNA binding protein
VEDLLLTVEEVAKWLRMNPQTVRKSIDRGELSAIHVGARRVRVRLDTVAATLVDVVRATEVNDAPALVWLREFAAAAAKLADAWEAQLRQRKDTDGE